MVAVALVGLGGLGLGLWRLPAPDKTRTVSVASQIGGPFKLTSHRGEAVSEADMRGKPYLLFFGFTHCPDVCPTTLQQIGDVLQALGPKGRDTRALFIAVDPERDTPAALKTYLASFDPRIVGLTGSPEEVNAVVKAYRAYVRKVPTKDGDYTMEHTALVYVMNGQNRFLNALNLARPPEAAAAELAKML